MKAEREGERSSQKLVQEGGKHSLLVSEYLNGRAEGSKDALDISLFGGAGDGTTQTKDARASMREERLQNEIC